MELIKPSPNSKYFIRDDLFKGMSPEDSYWLGVIVADGCIRVDGNSKKTGYDYKSYKITLSWQELDKEHLTKYRDYLGDSSRAMVKTKCNRSTQPSYQVNVQGRWLKDRVAKYGIIPGKTFNYCEYYEPPSYISDFIAGWFDGDGYFYPGRADDSFGKARLNITGEHNSLEWLKTLLYDYGYSGTAYVKPIKDKNASRLHITGRKQCREFYRLFYNPSLCLPRKWDKFKQIDY